MKKIIFLLLLCSILMPVLAQVELQEKTPVSSQEGTVSAYKEQLKLGLLVDSVQIGKKTKKLNLKLTLNINYESDYLQIVDDYYIKIFISRNQEYGKKFYSWKWDYLQKKGNNYSTLGSSYYAPMKFNVPISNFGSDGQGIGTQGASDFLMFYYRYKLE